MKLSDNLNGAHVDERVTSPLHLHDFPRTLSPFHIFRFRTKSMRFALLMCSTAFLTSFSCSTRTRSCCRW